MSNEDMNQLKLEVDSWSLASDCKLLEYLQNFSSNLTDKTKSFVGKVEELTFDVAESEVCLRNTFNEFLMLGNSQFIENVGLRSFVAYIYHTLKYLFICSVYMTMMMVMRKRRKMKKKLRHQMIRF